MDGQRKTAIGFLVIIFLLVPWGAAAQKQVKAIVGGTLVNPDGVKPLRDSIILIEDSRIVKVGTGKQVKIPATAEVIHAEGKWIIPGLVDTHIHFFQSGGLYTRPDVIDLRKYVPYQEQELAQIRLRLQDTFERYLRCGITSVVDVGGPFWNFAVRDLAAKTVRAPRVLVAGPLISTYQPEALTTDDPPILKVNTVEEAQALVRKQIARKTDLIKIWYIVQPGQKPEDFFALVRETVNESHRHGVRVAVHATGLETARKAVEAGADILVHDINDREVDPAFVALLKQRKVILTPTLIVFQRYSEVLSQQIRLNPWEFKLANPYVISSLFDLRVIPAEDISERVKERIRSIATPVQTSPIVLKNLKILQEAGVTIAAGTDAGNIGTLHGPSLFREFELMRDAGLSPRQILADATLNGARFMAREQELGSIAAKKLADLVILNADPLEDIRNLGNVYATVKNGNVFLASQLAVDSAAEVVQRQVNAYNARDIRAFLDSYSPTVQLYAYPDTLLATGLKEMEGIYSSLFTKTPLLHAEIKKRIVQGQVVIDSEKVTGFPDGQEKTSVAIYGVQDGLIQRVWLIKEQ